MPMPADLGELGIGFKKERRRMFEPGGRLEP